MHYAGQSIAIILANTQAQADAAALLVTATYTNVLPPILDIASALENPSRGVITFNMPPLVYGNVQNAFDDAPVIIEVCSDCQLPIV